MHHVSFWFFFYDLVRLIGSTTSYVIVTQVLDALDHASELQKLDFLFDAGRVQETKCALQEGRTENASRSRLFLEWAGHQDPRTAVERRSKPCVLLQPQECFAVNCEAAVGADFKFHFLSTGKAGSFQNSTAAAAIGLDENLASSVLLPDGFWVAADDAYVASMSFLTPWPGRYLLWNFFFSCLWWSRILASLSGVGILYGSPSDIVSLF